MNKDKIIATLREHAPSLRAQGVLHADLFGSRARGDYHDKSDIDILVEIDPNTSFDIYDYAGIKDNIATLFDIPVDVVNKAFLKKHIDPLLSGDVVRAF